MLPANDVSDANDKQQASDKRIGLVSMGPSSGIIIKKNPFNL
tara:strand:+ start:330 stop:455 length:126 start_codon:yes stop_codon:yes gene_type:complete